MRLSPGDVEKIRRLRAEGHSLRGIGELVGCSNTAVLHVLGRGSAPAVVVSRDGRRFTRFPPVAAKRCVWCGGPHGERRQYCSEECHRQRRRYRAYVEHRKQV